MKLLFKKFVVLLLCIPTYPLVMFAEWYDKSTHYGSKFHLRNSSVEYWAEVWEVLAYRKDG